MVENGDIFYIIRFGRVLRIVTWIDVVGHDVYKEMLETRG